MKLFFLGAGTPHLANWVRAFAQTGVDVVLLTLHRDRHFAPAVPCIDLSPRIRSKISYLRAVPAIRAAVAEAKPDLLVSYYASSYGVLGKLTGFAPRVVVTAGSDINVGSLAATHTRVLTRAALAGAESIVCWSPPMRRQLLALGARSDRIFMLPRGIPLDAIPPRRPAGGELRIACTRRFTRNFHHRTVLEACRLLVQRGVRCSLDLCGDGSERPAIQQLASELGLDHHVRFLGEVPHEHVLAVLARSDVAVSLAEKDGASASLFEAMAAGCYPIASRIPANDAWIQDGVNGRLVPLDQPVHLADVLAQLAADRDTLRQASEANQRLAREHLDIRVNTHRYLDHFSSLVQAHGRASR